MSYDLNGNMTSDGIRSYSWSARNQLAAIRTTTFQYDGSGRRSQNGAGVGFVYDGLNPVQEIVSGSVRANLLTGGLDEVFARTDTATSSFLTDALGSTLALADSTGTVQTQYTYDPFGNATSTGASSTNAFQYTGRENDGSSMYYYRARYYNAALQRFISEDPLGFAGGDVNFYAYVGNDPNDLTDAAGTCRIDAHFRSLGLGESHSYLTLTGPDGNMDYVGAFPANDLTGGHLDDALFGDLIDHWRGKNTDNGFGKLKGLAGRYNADLADYSTTNTGIPVLNNADSCSPYFSAFKATIDPNQHTGIDLQRVR